MERTWIGLGALAGLAAVAMSAAAAHALSARLDAEALTALRSAVQMQGWHALALVFCGLWAGRAGALAHAAAGCFAAGLLLFCTGIYAGILAGIRLPMVAPAGGTLLMLGWGFLAVSALVAGRR
jgi:uncharacterized membrane protein YgdD (TMEM256/DUF423 family)